MSNKIESLKDKWKGIPLKERWKDPEWREFMAAKVASSNKRRIGYSHSDETKNKIRASVQSYWNQTADDVRCNGSENTGQFISRMVPWNKGKTMSEAARLAISERMKLYYHTDAGQERLKLLAQNASDYHKGRPKSKEQREKTSASVAKVYQEQGFHPEYWTQRGHHESPKAGSVYYRSGYELAVYKQLDEVPEIATYKAEAVIVPYEWGGITRNYLPDLQIIFNDGSELIVEVKPTYALDDPQNQAKFQAAQAIYGDRFEIWSEEMIFNA